MITLQQVREFMKNSKSPVQLVKHYDEVLQKSLEWPAWAEQKEDGVWCGVVWDGTEYAFFSRTGNEFYAELDVEVPIDLIHAPAGLYIAELVNPSMSLETLSGLINTNRKASWTATEFGLMAYCQLRFHDYIALPALLAGSWLIPHSERISTLMTRLSPQHIIPGTVVHTDEQWRAFAQMQVDAGREGAVLKQLDADWVAGHKGYRVTKLVKGLDVDLRCVGVSLDGKGKRAGTLAKIMVSYKGKVVGADLGKGWTDEKRAALLAEYQEDPSSVVGRIWHIHALQEGSAGGLRLPKAMSRRIDKTVADDEE
ncbi:ATP-dependent DNA ligase [Aeromonas phage vB_AspA_Lolek]|nr:ATP-dependent DNA ligase [Aeromonas phage vB_AspA_Lolek]